MQNPSIYRFSVDWQTDAFKSDQFDKLFVEKKEEDTKDTKKKDKKTKATRNEETTSKSRE